MSAVTRIQEDVLLALEEDGFDRLPPLVFAKGSVRSYARALNLDEEDCVRLFSECSASFYTKDKGPSLVFPQVQLEGGPRSKVRRYVAVVLFGVLLLVLARVSLPPSLMPPGPAADRNVPVSQERGGGASQPAGVTNERADADAGPVDSTDALEPADDAGSPPAIEAVADADADAVAPEDGALPLLMTGSEDAPLVLELRASADVWAQVRSDDDVPREVLLREGERAQWRAHDRFLLTLGNAGMVETLFNGRPQGPFGGVGVVVRDIEFRL